MVHDAEIAATLMNRWGTAGIHSESALELLKEGRMQFTAERGILQTTDTTLRNPVEFESLLFDDGSRILRLVCAHTAQGLTPWSSVAPPTGVLDDRNRAADSRRTHGRPYTDQPHLLSE